MNPSQERFRERLEEHVQERAESRKKYDDGYGVSPRRDPLEVLAETLTQARREALAAPLQFAPEIPQLSLFGSEIEDVCGDCGGSGFDRGALREAEVCPTCKGSRVETYFLGNLFQNVSKERAA
jgi:hypothetical protein